MEVLSKLILELLKVDVEFAHDAMTKLSELRLAEIDLEKTKLQSKSPEVASNFENSEDDDAYSEDDEIQAKKAESQAKKAEIQAKRDRLSELENHPKPTSNIHETIRRGQEQAASDDLLSDPGPSTDVRKLITKRPPKNKMNEYSQPTA
jgi:hypothetical protein